MIFLFLLPSDIEKALVYKEKPSLEILNEFRKKYPDIEWVFEILYQRDFKKYDIQKLISLGAKKQYISAIINELLLDLSKKELKDSLRKIYLNYKSYLNMRSYEILYSVLKDRSILLELGMNFPKSKVLAEHVEKFPQPIKAQILYYSEKYADLVESIKPESSLYFYIDALSKLYRFKEASEICRNYRTTNYKKSDYFFECALNLIEIGDTTLAFTFLDSLYEYNPEVAVRHASYISISSKKYDIFFKTLKDTSIPEVQFRKAMVYYAKKDYINAISNLEKILKITNDNFELSRAYYWLYKLTRNDEYLKKIQKSHPNGYYSIYSNMYPKVVDSFYYDESKFELYQKPIILEILGFRNEFWKYINRENRIYLAYMLNKIGSYDLAIELAEISIDEIVPKNILLLAYPTPYYEEFLNASNKSGVEIELLYAIVREESRFQTNAVSIAGAMGIAQVMPDDFKNWTKKLDLPYKPFDVKINLLVGAMHFKEFLREFNYDINLTICAYNAGPNAVKRWLNNLDYSDSDLFFELIPYRETRNYYRRVMRSYLIYKYIFSNYK
ncbi:MAG: transglycosylase SLT domain-containing protein [candidate division WOR-3 bacterium]|nr:transglycosylase SLT domain-containing protein [candidate division WOR-3 bacterium]MDW8150072.1 transglycosylase SLT domain-containing protein [candidate division WOR-3 bacterium]